MATIASLRVLLEADTSKFREGMRNATDSIKRLGIATTAVAGGFAAIVQRSLDSADELQKLSLRTGASVEALSALRHAASLADTDIQALERGFVNMNRALAEAEDGTKSQKEAFAALNIDIAQFKQLRPEQQFALLSDRLNGLGDEARAAAVGNDIFGGSYRKLLPLLKGGSAGMREAQDEARRLGLILTQEQADGAAKANDAMQTLTNTIGALGQAFAVELAPAISDALEGITKNLPGIIASIKAAFSGVGTAIGGIAFAASELFRGNFQSAANTIGGIGGDVDAAVQAELDKVAENTREGNDFLRQIAENTASGARAQ